MNTTALLNDISASTKSTISTAENLKSLTDEALNRKENAASWSVLECFEHLNLYADFYNPEIRSVIRNAHSTHKEEFKSGWLGNWFANSMLPKEKLKKMKTAKDKNPAGRELGRDVIDKFIAHQNELIELLDAAKNVDLNKEKTSVSISKFIKLKLGDTFRFINNHTLRHMAQIARAAQQA